MAEIHALCFTTPRPWSAKEIRGLGLSRSVFFVKEPNGFLIGRVAANEAEILTLAVHPDHRRTGIGARLLQDFEETASKNGAVRFLLEVSDENSAAISLYRRHGYERAGYRKDYYASVEGKKSSAIVMVKEYPPA